MQRERQREMGRGDGPNEVGVRALRDGLGRYLAAVRDGQEPGPRFSPEPLENGGPLSDIVLEQRR